MIFTQAIVLRAQPHKEHDLLISLYTKEFGKRTVIARGTRKPQSKLAPFLHGLGVLRCGFVEGKSYPVLVDADMLFTVRYNAKVHMLFAETDMLCYEGQEDPEIWNLLVEALAAGGRLAISDPHYRGWIARLQRETYMPAHKRA